MVSVYFSMFGNYNNSKRNITRIDSAWNVFPPQCKLITVITQLYCPRFKKNSCSQLFVRVSRTFSIPGIIFKKEYTASQESLASLQNIGKEHAEKHGPRVATPRSTYDMPFFGRVSPRPWLVTEGTVHNDNCIRPVGRSAWKTPLHNRHEFASYNVFFRRPELLLATLRRHLEVRPPF